MGKSAKSADAGEKRQASFASQVALALVRALLGDQAECQRTMTALLAAEPSWLDWTLKQGFPAGLELGSAAQAAHWLCEYSYENVPPFLRNQAIGPNQGRPPADEPWLTLPELAALVERLKRLDLLENAFQDALETEKLTSLKELAQAAGHEINNPLANITTRAQSLLRDEEDPERRRMLASIVTQSFRAHEMIGDLMLFARPPQLVRQSLDVCELARTICTELGSAAVDQQTELELDVPDRPVELSADGDQLAVAIQALCINALESLRRGGKVRVAVRGQTRSGTADAPVDWVEILVADNGPGIRPEVRRHLFDPFYSGREAGRGMGFGLSKCWRIVTAHGGRIDVASTPWHETVITVLLPA